MKHSFSFFQLLLLFSLSFSVYSQQNTHVNTSFLQDNFFSIWDVQLNINVTGSSAVKHGTFFYVADQGSNLIRGYDVSGNLIYTFSIPGVTGLKDLAFDGTFEYGGIGTNVIYQMNFQTQTLIGTINTPAAVRHIAYDSDNDAFWIGSWNDPIMLISRNGTVLNTLNIQLPQITGSAYDNQSPGGPYLWVISGGTPDSILIRQVRLTDGTLTGVMHDVLSDIGIGQTNAASGGLFFMGQFITNTFSLGGVLVGSPTKLFVYEIHNSIPVELVSFSAKVIDGGIKLSWSTATEINNKGFEIEKAECKEQKTGEIRWESVGFIPGSGTTTDPKNYLWIDNDSRAGKFIYRLKQLDFDGSYHYSDEVKVDAAAPSQFYLSQNYPNPFNPVTTIEYRIPEKSFLSLVLFDAVGKQCLILENGLKDPGNYKVSLDARGLSSGIYFYKLYAESIVNDDTYTVSGKMVLLK